MYMLERPCLQVGQPLPAAALYAHVVWAGSNCDVTDEEAPTAAVPTCALWAPTGLTVLPPRHAAALSPGDTARFFAEVLSRSSLWGGQGPTVRLSTPLSTQPLQKAQPGGPYEGEFPYTGRWQPAQSM